MAVAGESAVSIFDHTQPYVCPSGNCCCTTRHKRSNAELGGGRDDWMEFSDWIDHVAWQPTVEKSEAVWPMEFYCPGTPESQHRG